MAAADSKQKYVEKCELAGDRIGVTFQFATGLKFVWWHRKEDCVDVDSDDAAGWIICTANDYKGCARRLAGDDLSFGFPNIAMGNLKISIGPKADGTATIEITHYFHNERPILETVYSFTMPAVQAAAAFKEAGKAIRKMAEAAHQKAILKPAE